MSTLFLCVDRDDDLGQKGLVETPLLGEAALLEAAQALGIADPGDSDTNALFAAVHLARQEPGSQVAAIAGHPKVGLRSDSILADQLDQVLQQAGTRRVVLVTDGAEDEQILPIITQRATLLHVHRSIVKQAPKLEGLYFVLTRMMEDEKIAKRFLLPTSLIILVWAIAFLANLANLAVSLTLGIAGAWLLTHAMGWEDRALSLARDFREGVRTGRLSFVASVLMWVVFGLGALQSWKTFSASGGGFAGVLASGQTLLPFVISGLLVRLAGRMLEGMLVEGKGQLFRWTQAFTLIAVGLLGDAALEAAVRIVENVGPSQVLTFEIVVRALVGVAVLIGGGLMGRYVRRMMGSPA